MSLHQRLIPLLASSEAYLSIELVFLSKNRNALDSRFLCPFKNDLTSSVRGFDGLSVFNHSPMFDLIFFIQI